MSLFYSKHPFLILFILFSGTSLPLFSLPLISKGNITYSQWFYPFEDEARSHNDHIETLQAKGEFILQTDKQIEFKYSPRFIFDYSDADRNRWLHPDDLYLDYFTDMFEIRLGYQLYSWKTVESVSHADFLNQTDRQIDFLDGPKLGEPSARARLILPTESEQVIEVYYFLHMTPTQFSREGIRQQIIAVENNPAYHKYNGDYGAWMPQAATRYQTHFLDVDVSLFYFNGYDRFPGVIAGEKGPIQEYRKLHKTGLTFQGVLGHWLVKGEGVYTDYLHDITQFNPFPVKNELLSVSPFFSYTAGFEITYYSLLVDNHDVGFISEITGDTDAGKDFASLGTFRLFQNHVFKGLRYTFNNVSDRSLLAGSFYDYLKGDVVAQVEYNERLFKNLKLKLKYRGIYLGLLPGFDDSSPSILGMAGKGPIATDFEKQDRIEGDLVYTF